jgi:hypothetical protein
MAAWFWARLPVSIQEGLRRADFDALGPLCAWLHDAIERRRTVNEDGDVAEGILADVHRMMTSVACRRSLTALRSVPAFLARVEARVRRGIERSESRRRAALVGLVVKSHVETPAEHAEYRELLGAVERAIATLAARDRKILALHLQGQTADLIARQVLGTPSGGGPRVRKALERLRRTVVQILGPAFDLAAPVAHRTSK